MSIRPSLVLSADDYANIIPLFQQRPTAGRVNLWSYIDVLDLADLIVLAVEATAAGHEVVYAVQPDNYVGRTFKELVATPAGRAHPTKCLSTSRFELRRPATGRRARVPRRPSRS